MAKKETPIALEAIESVVGARICAFTLRNEDGSPFEKRIRIDLPGGAKLVIVFTDEHPKHIAGQWQDAAHFERTGVPEDDWAGFRESVFVARGDMLLALPNLATGAMDFTSHEAGAVVSFPAGNPHAVKPNGIIVGLMDAKGWGEGLGDGKVKKVFRPDIDAVIQEDLAKIEGS